MTEKTEQPTDKKLRDAREKGDVAHSKDAAKAFLVWGCLGYVALYGKRIIESFAHLIHWTAAHAYAPFPQALKEGLEVGTQEFIDVLLPFIIIVAIFGILGEVLHIGILVAPEKISPNLQKFNAVSNVKEMFSLRNLLEGLKSILKVTTLTSLFWFIIKDNIGVLLLVPPAGIGAIGEAFGTLLKSMLIGTGILFGLVAGADLFLQRMLYIKRNKMTKDEVKRERKDMDGDPHIKHHRKKLHRELLDDTRRQNIRDSSAVVVNPTHYAVVLYYNAEETPLPLVVDKGEDLIAQMIVSEARDAGVPVIQNIYLTRALIAEANLHDYVPTHLLEATVEVLLAVREMGSSWH